MSWVKADGARIKITFDNPVVSGQIGQEDYFAVIVPEYTYVPGGALQDVTKVVKYTYAFAKIQQTIDLHIGALTDTAVIDSALCLVEA